jgi:dihydrolipoamide dehydrogenase
MRSYDFDNHVCIIEGGNIGGAGIVDGALTSKTMWELSANYAIAKRTDRGYRVSGLSVDYDEVIDSVYQAARDRQYQMLSQIETFSKEKSKTKSLRYIQGWGRFTEGKKVIVEKVDGEQVEIRAKDYIIATGSIPREHPTIEIDKERVITSDHVLSLKQFPKRILIIGAGIVGCEFATIFANFGQTQVHLLDSQDRVIPFEDHDVSDYANTQLSNIGVNILHQAQLREIRKEPTHIDVILDHLDGHTEVLAVDTILISIGRVPNVQTLGLEHVGIEVNERGMINVDNECRVTDNIYAVGDISGNMALVNIAEMEGRFAAKAIEKRIKFPLKYNNISTIMFFHPEIAAVGLTERECKEQKIAYRVVFYKHSLVSRAIAMHETDGFFKLLVTDEENPRVLGARAAGLQAAASIMYLAVVMDQEHDIKAIMKTTHPHPSMSEGIQECLRTIVGKPIYKPEAFPNHIGFKVWRP